MKKSKIMTKRNLFAMVVIGLLATNCAMADLLPHPGRKYQRPQPVKPYQPPRPPKPEPVKPMVVNPPKNEPNDQKPPKPAPSNVLPD